MALPFLNPSRPLWTASDLVSLARSRKGRPPANVCVPPLTDVSTAGLDDDGPPAASLLLHQRHALPGLLVRVIGGADSDLVLDPGQAVQLNAAFTV